MIVRRILYSMIILFAVILLLFYHDYFFFLLLAGLLGLPIFAICVLHDVINKTNITLQVPELSIEEGNVIKLQFQVENNSIFSLPYVTIFFRVENAFYPHDEIQIMQLPLHAKKTMAYEWNVTSLYAGMVKIYVSDMECRDYLGIQKKSKKVQEEYRVVVTPKQVVLATDFIARHRTVALEKEDILYFQGMEDVSEVADIREFQNGDRIQRIHWKLSSKNEELYVKEYAREQEQVITLLLELHQDEKEIGYFNEMFTAFYSSSQWLLAQDMVFAVQWYDKRLQQSINRIVTCQEELLDVLQHFYGMQPYQQGYPAYDDFLENEIHESLGAYYFAPMSFTTLKKHEVVGNYEDKVMILWLASR